MPLNTDDPPRAETPPDAKRWLLDTLEACDPDGWVVLVRWCAEKLARDDQALLAEILCGEAERRAERINRERLERDPNYTARHYPGDCIAGVLQDCGLKLEVVKP